MRRKKIENETKVWNASIYKCLCYTFFVNSIYLSNFESTQTKPCWVFSIPKFSWSKKTKENWPFKDLTAENLCGPTSKIYNYLFIFSIKIKNAPKKSFDFICLIFDNCSFTENENQAWYDLNICTWLCVGTNVKCSILIKIICLLKMEWSCFLLLRTLIYFYFFKLFIRWAAKIVNTIL